MKEKILVALSGGVDSSVCVHLLKEQGYDVSAVVLELTEAHKPTVADARRAAEQLGIPLYVKKEYGLFESCVIDYFVESYCSGVTPNPCIVCNPLVKFKCLLDAADELGIHTVATGHYAALEQRDGLTYLKKGENAARDQSYMLYRLGQKELSRLLFPLAEMSKDEVRQVAASIGLDCADKPDSQENCFIPDNDYAGFIEARRGKLPVGDFISPEGKPCGKHKGILHYTVGQRKGLGIALGRPVFIKEIDAKTNRIYLADRGGEYADAMTVSGLSETFPGALELREDIAVKVRSRAKPSSCLLQRQGDKLQVTFLAPERAPARGQSAVFYQGDLVLGGGFIE